MTVGAPRRAVSIDPKTRELAETLARQAGLSLSDWLAGMVGAQGPDDALSHEDFDAPAGAAYLETPRMKSGAPNRIETADHPGDELARMTIALDRLTSRIEAAETRSTMAITGVERTVRGALSRLGDAEREQVAVAARFEGAIAETRTEQSRVAQRLGRIEDEARGPRSAEAIRSLEATLGKVAGHLYEGEDRGAKALAEMRAHIDKVEGEGGGAIIEAVVSRVGARLEEAEARTTSALRSLQLSFAALDERLSSLEDSPRDGGSPLEQIAADLAGRVDAARSEMDERLRLTAEGQFQRVDKALGEMTEHVRVAETRSAQAIERMGREVVDMAGVLARRVQSVEHASADAIEQVGGEMARIAQSMESRLGRADAVQAQALEKLGGEIARITERLAERIGGSERRSAAAIDEVGDQVARVTERLSQRHERASEELAERIRLSEERTARFLEEARQTIEGLSKARSAPPAADDPTAAFADAEEEPIYGEDPFALFQAPPPADEAVQPPLAEAVEVVAPVEGAAEPDALAADAEAIEPVSPVATTQANPWPGAFSQEDFDAADGFAPEAQDLSAQAWTPPPAADPTTDIAPGATDDIDEHERPGTVDWPAQQTTREAVERARLAAVAASRPASIPRGEAHPHGATAAPGLFRHMPFERPRRRSRLGPAVLGVGLAAAFGVALGGFWVVEDVPHGALVKQLAQVFGGDGADGGPFPMSSTTLAQAPAPGTPQVAIAIAPTRIDGMAAGAAAAKADDLARQYSTAVARLEAADKTGLPDLRRLADLGYAPAQFYLAKLYETGADGLKKDPSVARSWTQRAAEAGEAKAMHNLALDYFEGAGGPKDATLAAQWFRKAADLGLEDSQYNLGRLYEEGFGVAQNQAEAYKWYLIAARSGDAEARAAAARMKAALTPQAQSAAERTASSYRPAVVAASPSAGMADATASGALATAQKALSALGYYQGPTDGASSPALRLAISAYQHDQGLSPTGVADPVTLAKLSAFNQAPPPPPS